MLTRATLLIMASSLLLAVLCILPATQSMTPLWIIARGANVGDTMAHELGHAAFAWVFGMPAIPSIFTVFGSDQAGGLTLFFGHSWIVQGMAFLVMAYGCWWLRDNASVLFYPASAAALVLAVLAFTRWPLTIATYMGHGSAILVGGALLFRAWLDMDARNTFEWWLNGFFGWFLTLRNILFAWTLAFMPGANEEYSGKLIGGVTHHDFMAMAEQVPGWTVHGIALFTIGYGMAVIIGAFGAAAWFSATTAD